MSHILIIKHRSSPGEQTVKIASREDLDGCLEANMANAETVSIDVYELVESISRRTTWEVLPRGLSAGPDSKR